jgi:AraC family transcriptional regulator
MIRRSMPSRADLLSLLRHVRRRLDGDVSLEALAARSGWSSFHLHRAFRRVVGETPKAYTQRLRLDRAAARLTTSTDRIVDVALDAPNAIAPPFGRQ